jgi:proteasome lid subunit RPN8/RPN11
MERMLAHVRSSQPQEACGLLSGIADKVHQVIPIANAEESAFRFKMDPRAQVEAMIKMEETGQQLVGIYHSHPKGPAGPSELDRSEAAYPEAAYLIFSPWRGEWRCQAFAMHPDAPTEIPIILDDDETPDS